jgi:hypothetical protein
MKEFKIPGFKYENLVSKIEKLNRKAVKINCPEITIKEIKREKLSIGYRKDMTGFPYGPEMFLEYVFCTIDGKAPMINGFSFVASIDHSLGTNIIRRFDLTASIENYLTLSSLTCEHCHIERQRNSTFLIKDVDGNIKQVGSTCLKDFLGFNVSPDTLAEIASMLETAGNDDSSDDIESGFSGGYTMPSIMEYTLHSLAIIKADGYYRSKAKSEETGLPTTSAKVEYNIDPKTPKSELIPIVESDYINAQKVIDYLKTFDAKSEYESNLKAIFQEKCFSYKYLGFVVSAVWFYLKANNLTPEFNPIEKAVNTSSFLGNIKDKIGNIKAEIILIRSIPSDYGITTLFKFKDENGNFLSWFSSNSFGFCENENVKTVNIPVLIEKATIKALNEFKGNKETVLTRAKFTCINEVDKTPYMKGE